MRRDLREILCLIALLLIGHAANNTWNTYLGGWQEWASNIGGVLYLSGLVILTVALIAAVLRRLLGRFANPS